MLKKFLLKKSMNKHKGELSDKEFLEQILNLCAKYPDVHNPADEYGNCYYTSNSDTVRTAYSNNHCLMGQWWIEYGGHESSLLPTQITSIDVFLQPYYPDRICGLARLVQDMADRKPVIVGSSLPPLWRDVAVRIKNSFRSELS